jgi:hypothetical protein
VVCSGYRDTEELRILDETRAVQAKALRKDASNPGIQVMTLSLLAKARHAFLNHYIDGVSKTWYFLIPFFQAVGLPECLVTTMDAASLAFFGHQVRSQAALNAARQKYVNALHSTRRAVRDENSATSETTILSTLLLDLFEKLQSTQPSDVNSYTGHVSGALTLARLRGLEGFQDPSAGSVLVRLTTNLVISCMASSTKVPDGLHELRNHAARLLSPMDPKYEMCDLNAEYADLRGDIRTRSVTIQELIDRTERLHDRYLSLTVTMPCTWWYETTMIETSSERVYQGRYDVYLSRHVRQTCNIIRSLRIMLNESLVQYYTTLKNSNDGESDSERNIEEKLLNAMATINTLAHEVCYSATQYIDCFGPASPNPGSLTQREQRDSCGRHTPEQQLNCYSLIFPLYVSARSSYVPLDMRYWVVKQLRCMGDHFGIMNAELVCQILENRDEDVSPWFIYGMLGSYAFAA